MDSSSETKAILGDTDVNNDETLIVIPISVSLPLFIAKHIKGKTLTQEQIISIGTYLWFRQEKAGVCQFKIDNYLEVCTYDSGGQGSIFGLTYGLEFFDSELNEYPDIKKHIVKWLSE